MKRTAVVPTALYLVIVASSTEPVAQAAVDQEMPVVSRVELQPLTAQVQRVAHALEYLGNPLTPPQRESLNSAISDDNPSRAVRKIQHLLDSLCLAFVEVNPEGRVKATAGPARATLVEKGWRVFLVKVHNQAGVTAPLRCRSPNAVLPYDDTISNEKEPPQTVSTRDLRDRWLDVRMYDEKPLVERLSGLELEYRILELYSRDSGKREAKLQFDAGQGTQDVGFRSELNVLFRCQPANEVHLEVLDQDGQPTMGQFTIRDAQGRVYPARTRRLAPDFFFHNQVYRAHGESILLPAGKYAVTYTRGPEYQVERREMEVNGGGPQTERFQLRRWIHMAKAGWYSGDHHIHAAGCSHYASPTQGVTPSDMMRHILGEDLNVGCVLTWGPCWYHQKQFFAGTTDELSTDHSLMRYDVEVSGFPSSHAGHLVLLRLSEDDYPGTTRIDDWPSWNLPIMKWAKSQNAVVGFAHSGWGLQTETEELPNYEIPPFDGIGANEYIVDVTHDVCDMISTIDTTPVYELNIWYHTLNCGFTTRISGETDFPCIYDDRVGRGRVYVKLSEHGPLDFDAWVDGLRDGRSYCSEGSCHLFDFQANDLAVGEPGGGGRPSFLPISKGDELQIQVSAAALLDESPNDELRNRDINSKPYWHIERARVDDTRTVNVELVVNGEVVDSKPIEANGSVEELIFRYTPTQSSWVAVRVLPAAHTNPIFVEVDGKPIRASKRSAEWCLQCVDQCWKSKSRKIRSKELMAAASAYEHARQAYRKIFDESYDDRKTTAVDD